MSRRIQVSTEDRIQTSSKSVEDVIVFCRKQNGVVHIQIENTTAISTTTTHSAVIPEVFRPTSQKRLVLDSDATNVIKVAINSSGDYIVTIVGTATLAANEKVCFTYLME